MNLWLYGQQDEGRFEHVGGAGWVEANPTFTGNYLEVSKDWRAQIVLLHDYQRNLEVLLTPGLMYSRAVGAPLWNAGYAGHWAS